MQNRWAPHPCAASSSESGVLTPLRMPLLRSGGFQPQPDWGAVGSPLPMPGRGLPTTSGIKNQQGFCPGELEGFWKPRCPLKGPTHRLTGSETLTLSPSKGTAVQKAPET